MSIKYTVVPNALHDGQFYARPFQINTRDLETLIRNISDKTTLSASDVEGVMRAFMNEVIQGILDGDRVSFDGLVAFRPRLTQKLNSAADSFDPAVGTLHVSATIKPQLVRKIRSSATFEKIVTDEKKPLPKSYFDSDTKQIGVYTPGSIGQINGKNLKLLDTESTDEGVFFIDNGTGNEVRATVYQNNGDRELVFLVPDSLSGSRSVEVRTRYTPTGELRMGRLNATITAA